jgi:inner membrane protein
MFKTHMLFSYLICLISLSILNPKNVFGFMILFLVAGAFPDIDHPKSKIGKKVKIIAFLFEHRGFFHSLIAAILFSIGAYYLFGGTEYSWAIFLGYSSHLILDLLSHQGIMPIHPFSKFRLSGVFKTGGFFEWILFVSLIFFDIYFSIKYFF